MVKPEYSICITHYNNMATIRESLDSILEQTDSRFEIVVVDNSSSDGSKDFLQELAHSAVIRLIERRSSRGGGRQIALENARGSYVIANLDLDDLFKPRLKQLLDFYHARCEGMLLWAVGKTTTVAPRSLLHEIGGWKNLQYGEDREIWNRAARAGRFLWTVFPMVAHVGGHPERQSLIGKLRFRYVYYRDLVRSGRRTFEPDEPVDLGLGAIALLARLLSPFYESYGKDLDKTFMHPERFYVDSDGWFERDASDRQFIEFARRWNPSAK